MYWQTADGMLILASCGDYLQTIRDKGLLVAAAERAMTRTVTGPILAFEVLVILGSLLIFRQLSLRTNRLWLRVLTMGSGVFLFEAFTSPMWHNDHLGPWAYLYCDVSWILTLGWTAMIMGVLSLVDRCLPGWREPQRFLVSLAVLLVLVVGAEMVVVGLGIRSYSPEVREALSGTFVRGVPLEILYYVPVFLSLVIAFYRYWNFVIDDAALVPVRKRRWIRATALALLSVFLFELMVEPVVQNRQFPEWSYVYRDISLLYTLQRVLLIAAGAVVVERLVMGLSIPLRFATALVVISAAALPVEAWFIVNGYRVYGSTATAGYSGFTVPLLGVPVEIAFAIPCYLALIVSFIRYWEIVFDNRL